MGLLFRNIVLFCLFGTFPLSVSGSVKIVENSKSDYQIVIPDKDRSRPFNYFLEQSANLLRNCILESTGAALPVLEESKAIKTRPGIYIGYTAKASSNGINPAAFTAWEYIIKTSGRDIILIGKDAAGGRANNKSNDYTSYELGTVKAVTSFLEKYCGTRFVIPGINGVSVQKQSEIELPSALNISRAGIFKYCIGRASHDIFYDIANNFYPTVRSGSYGGHSHPAAIPQDKYFKEHPEYFALVKGRRYTHETRPQYCLSNPDVQELIYKELLHKLDEGYEYAQLAQSDGFIPCECEKCASLYGVKRFGEKLWIMHRNMVERLLKDRPGQKVMILSYEPTAAPPETFREFPSSAIVELCAYSPESLTKWKNCKVPGGFTAYIYNWGFYKTEGFAPKHVPEFCKQQIELFKANNIWGIYRCGFGELYGLEGPVYYTWGKLLEDSTEKPEAIADEFCDFAYPDSSRPMKKFFELLHERLKIYMDCDGKKSWGDPGLLDGKMPDMLNNVKLLSARYPSDVTAKMQSYLDEASSIAKDKKEIARIKIVKREFEYLKKTALIAELYDKYNEKKAINSFNSLLDAVDSRNNFIDSLKTANKDNNIADYEGCRSFDAAPPAALKAGGRLRGELKTPYDWNTSYLRKMNIVPGSRAIKVLNSAAPVKLDGIPDEDVWKNAEPQNFVELFMDGNVKVPEISVQAARDKKALYVLLKCKKYIPAKWDEKTVKDSFYVFFGPAKTLEETYMFTGAYSNTLAAAYKRFQTDNPDAPNEFKAVTLDKKVDIAWKIDADGGITAEYRIPFSIFKTAPESGDVWYGNFLRRISNGRSSLDFIWEPNINWKTWRNRYDVMGKIIFE